jgi:uncharacterized DUF497 family protein
MRFERDDAKASSNARKHGVTFDQAITAFNDPFGLIAPDEEHSTAEEKRYWLIGECDQGAVVVVFTKRQGGSVWRIVSARRANRREKRRYEEFRRIPL